MHKPNFAFNCIVYDINMILQTINCIVLGLNIIFHYYIVHGINMILHIINCLMLKRGFTNQYCLWYNNMILHSIVNGRNMIWRNCILIKIALQFIDNNMFYL